MTNIPCTHLEELLPKITSTTIESRNTRIRYNDKLHYGDKFNQGNKQLRHRLSLAGLDPVEIDILILRYEYDETFSSIQKELGLLSVDTVERMHKQVLKKLKGLIW